METMNSETSNDGLLQKSNQENHLDKDEQEERLSSKSPSEQTESVDRVGSKSNEESTDSRLSSKSADDESQGNDLNSPLRNDKVKEVPPAISKEDMSFSNEPDALDPSVSNSLSDGDNSSSIPVNNEAIENDENVTSHKTYVKNKSLSNQVQEAEKELTLNGENCNESDVVQTSSQTANDNNNGGESTSSNIEKPENQEENNGKQELKIQMVKTLGPTDVFVEPPTGPNSPDVVMSNPLESSSDREETSDSVRAENNSSSGEPMQVDGDASTEGDKTDAENEQAEVITGDKTISPEYVQKNINAADDDRDTPSTVTKGDHVYSRKTNGAVNSLADLGDKTQKKTLKVLYPKKKHADVDQLLVNKLTIPILKNCIQCTKVAHCIIQVEIGGSECYLCSEECLKQHKTVQFNTLQKKNEAVVPLQDISSEARLCVNCDTNVTILPEDKILSWEAMEFCNEDCLAKYQAKMWSYCSLCKKDVSTPCMGKYCVRFGHEMKQFCTSGCLEEFKKGIKVCSFCQKDLSDGEGFLASIDKGHFRDFCSQNCLDEYDCMSRNLPAGGLKVEACGVCDKTQLVQVQVITPTNTVNLCSEVCFAAFKFVNTTISTAPCSMCKKYYDRTLPNACTSFYENGFHTFCSKSCMNVSILTKRKIVSCNWCKVKKYNFDMIRRKSNNTVNSWCSVNCMHLYKVSISAVTLKSKVPCAQCKKLEVPQFHLTMSDATVRNLCSSDCVNIFQGTFTSKGAKNSVFPTGPPKRVVMTRTIVPTQSADGNSLSTETVSSPSTSAPQALISVKKPEIKVINPQVMNGPITSGPMSPSTQNTACSQRLQLQFVGFPTFPPEVKNATTQVFPERKSKGVSTIFKSYHKAVQTEEEKKEEGEEAKERKTILVPVPVPIYIPCPMAMYSIPVPTPLPLPLPIPVPVFIPTTKGTAEEIFAEIKRIQEKMPGNPYEAELIMMAEMAEEQKKSREGDLEGTSTPDSERLRGVFPEAESRSESFGSEDVLQMALSMASDMTPTPGSSDAREFTQLNDTVGEERRLGQKRSGSNSDGGESIGGPPEKKRREDCTSTSGSDSLEGAIVHQLANSRLNYSLKETLGVSAWRHYAEESGERTNLLEMRPGELAQALRRFILNAKIPKGGDYTPDQKYYLMLGIQYYLKENGKIDNIFFDKLFDPFIDALNEEGKKFQNIYASCDKVYTRVEEEHLWESKQLGPHSPATLLATLIYFNTKYFHLTTVEEHMQLSFSHIMKHWKRNPNASPANNNNSTVSRNILLRFYPPQSILDANSKKKKVYEQEANEEDPYRCPIHLYEFYVSKCPESVKSRSDLFYVSPERSCVPDSPIWYSTLPLAQEVIERTLNRFKMVKEINEAILSST